MQFLIDFINDHSHFINSLCVGGLAYAGYLSGKTHRLLMFRIELIQRDLDKLLTRINAMESDIECLKSTRHTSSSLLNDLLKVLDARVHDIVDKQDARSDETTKSLEQLTVMLESHADVIQHMGGCLEYSIGYNVGERLSPTLVKPKIIRASHFDNTDDTTHPEQPSPILHYIESNT